MNHEIEHSQNGYKILEAVDGKDALRRAEYKTNCLIIVYLSMLNMDGLEQPANCTRARFAYFSNFWICGEGQRPNARPG